MSHETFILLLNLLWASVAVFLVAFIATLTYRSNGGDRRKGQR